ncbi:MULTISPECIES: hypothetical protein [unclassified Bradyrhizobium]|uniref:hypothetical protein n=1 Tax=unclassified Bradyrhizobium TaxID=2631580 RepID=UPI002FEFFCBD
MSKEETFYLEEYKSLRQDMISKLKDRLDYSRWGVIGIAALYSYSISNPGYPVLFWVPVLFSILMIAHLNEEHRMVQKMSQYVEEQIEPWIAGGKAPEGWQQFLKREKTPRWWLLSKRFPWHLWDWSPVPMWVVLFFGTFLAAIAVTRGLIPSVSVPKC